MSFYIINLIKVHGVKAPSALILNLLVKIIVKLLNFLFFSGMVKFSTCNVIPKIILTLNLKGLRINLVYFCLLTPTLFT